MKKEENTTLLKAAFEELGETHQSTSIDTPLKKGAFDLSDEEKMDIIADKFGEIMDTLGLDLSDDSLKGTPYRVAKMFVKEIFYGLNPENKPKMSLFDNKYQYDKFIIEKDITVNSTCEHHFLPVVGKAHVGYISNGTVIGLSKINRIVDFFARRPQVQERMTRQILEELKKDLNTEDVIVMVDAKHFCVATRGIEDMASTTITMDYSGQFSDHTMRREFLDAIK
ncbi:GTP cyclohydrolase I FolE [Membranicola marinus]|uniref:GTP cyclohydrolase 1 n=1 Tax=Membranihabitans marinus TaxID=1227546 RepID=A0A953HQL2_9BACT|nr:GTP cyclohydrolase I FolE [Membranihabitans marinus]MBY5956590.1 GTP cyclohydrolase I FolE [Membranihabitans marinus]